MGKQHYTKMMRWGKRIFISALKAVNTPSDHHMLHIPGDNDARVPAPLVGFLHQSLSGLASSIYTESRMANVLSALEGAGYMVVASDNGPNATTAGGTQDKYGNQAGLDDYASMALRCSRQILETHLWTPLLRQWAPRTEAYHRHIAWSLRLG